jgi:hypothetical protein
MHVQVKMKRVAMMMTTACGRRRNVLKYMCSNKANAMELRRSKRRRLVEE